MVDVLVVGAGPRHARLIARSLSGAQVHVRRRRWSAFLEGRRGPAPELVIYDLAGPDAPRTAALADLTAQMPGTSALYLAEQADSLERLRTTLERPDVDFALSPDDPGEVRLRASRLLARRRTTLAHTLSGDRPAASVLEHTVPALRASNGRLDARAVSVLMGIPLAALARSLGRSEQAVHKTPSAPSLQPALRPLEQIASALLRLTGSEAGVRAWLHAPNPEIEEATPIELLLNGEINVIVDLLEAAASGEPA